MKELAQVGIGIFLMPVGWDNSIDVKNRMEPQQAVDLVRGALKDPLREEVVSFFLSVMAKRGPFWLALSPDFLAAKIRADYVGFYDKEVVLRSTLETIQQGSLLELYNPQSSKIGRWIYRLRFPRVVCATCELVMRLRDHQKE